MAYENKKDYCKFCLSEYARYLHANLDQDIEKVNLDNDFTEEFKDHWLKNLPFDFQVR